MRKRYVASAVGALGVSAIIGYLLNDKKRGDKSNQSTLLENAGIPDQIGHGDLENIENAKMVSEGSQYGVSYYNEVRSEDEYSDRGNLQ